MASFNISILMFISPLIGIILLLFVQKDSRKQIFSISIWTSCITFLFSLLLWVNFNSNTVFFQFVYKLKWFDFLNIHYQTGLDGISLFFLILSTFLIILCVLTGFTTVKNFLKEYMICFLLLEFFLIQVFCVLDILLFYIFFESVLLPMFLIIGIWGSRERKIKAAYQFFLYTLIGSLFTLLAILVIYFEVGTTDILVLWNFDFSFERQIFLWIAFFLSFSIKIPMIPFHIWLPEAHSEAPTSGSIILAGILLKLGGYGFLRFSLPLLPEASIYFTPIIYVLSLVAIIYASLTTLRQVDLKKIIAYSSISHMGLVTLGLFSYNIEALEGSIFLMVSHGLISSALFFCIGILYDRYHTRILKYYSGLVVVMPLFVIYFLFLTFANIGFPGTSSFIGEILIFSGVFQFSSTLMILVLLNMILSIAYSIWLCNRLNFNNLKLNYIHFFQDISRREFWILCSLSAMILWFGLFPSIILNHVHMSVLKLLEILN